MHLFLSPPGPGQPGPEIDSLNGLLRGELSAVGVYARALGWLGGHPAEAELRRIRHDHESSAAALRELIRNLDGEPDETPSAWSSFAPAVAPVGPAAVLVALKLGEEQGLRECEAFLQAEEMREEARFAVRTQVLPRCHEHIEALAGLAGGSPPKG